MSVSLGLLGGALWLGVLTSLSPCPLATNLAATGFLARQVDSRKRAVAGAVCYALGRVAAYVAVAALLALGVASAPGVSQSLQKWMPPLLGPLLILTAMVLLGWLSLPFQIGGSSQEGARRWADRGVVGALVLGFLFGLSFCPVSAAMFFGTLLPMALDEGSVMLPVSLFGFGTAAPVAVFSLVMVFSARGASRMLGGVSKVQPWILKITGYGLLLAGLYLTARDTLEMIP
ncbi:MAG: aromatic aminobenezylarsenical efflux permease ArsG family transporter [Verrucomicrobiales bacterium]|nr:aromatic aminobenezylarsenical efflux permease ArsG family transporter [Verrucomicrobiota bacterium JB025]